MPYGQKYKLPFTSITGRNITVYLEFKTYGVGQPTTILQGGPEPFSISNQSSDDDILIGIRGTEATITYVDDGTVPVTEFASDDDEGVRIVAYDDDTTEMIWTGFIVQDDCRQPFLPAPNTVTLRATDNLGLLKELEFTDLAGAKVFDKLLLTEYFNILLNKTGLSLPVNTFCNVFENGMNDRSVNPANDPFAQTKVHTRTFTKDTATFQSCYDILKNILEAWECQLFQYMGQWFIVRWVELKDFNNLIKGTLYASDLTLPTATISPSTIPIGRTRSIKFANASQVQSILRSIKYDKLTFNYEQPYKLILNDDLMNIGSLISTSTTGTERTDKYNALDYTYINPPASTFYIVVKTNTITGIETDRYLVMPFNGSFTSYVNPTLIEVNKNDRFECSISFRTNTDISDNIIFRFGFLLYGASGTHWSLTNVSGHLQWNNIGAGTTANSLTQTVLPSDDSSQWTQMDVFSGTSETYIPPIPEDGNLQIELKGFNDPNASQPNEDTFIKDIRFTYYSYINSSTLVTGQYHKSLQPVKGGKKNIDKQIFLDDSPKNNIRGCMFLADGTTKTALWHGSIGSIDVDFQTQLIGNKIVITGHPEYIPKFRIGSDIIISNTTSNNGTFTVSSIIENTGNFQVGVTPALALETVINGHIAFNLVENVQFGYIQKLDLMKLNAVYRTRIEGDALGLYSGGYLGLLSVFSLDDLPNKFFIMSTTRMNYKSEKWSGVIQEIWDNTENMKDDDFTNTFSYIYKTQ